MRFAYNFPKVPYCCCGTDSNTKPKKCLRMLATQAESMPINETLTMAPHFLVPISPLQLILQQA